MSGRKSNENIGRWLETGIDLPGRTLLLTGDVDDEMLTRATAAFHLFPKDKDVTILLNSEGGGQTAGLAIYDLIKNHPKTVTIRVVGYAASMACVILQAGDIRQATPNSVIMHHTGTTEVDKMHNKNFKLFVDFYNSHSDRIDNIMLSRVNERRAKDGLEPRTMAWWRERDLWDRFMFPDEAIANGFLDEIYP